MSRERNSEQPQIFSPDFARVDEQAHTEGLLDKLKNSAEDLQPGEITQLVEYATINTNHALATFNVLAFAPSPLPEIEKNAKKRQIGAAIWSRVNGHFASRSIVQKDTAPFDMDPFQAAAETAAAVVAMSQKVKVNKDLYPVIELARQARESLRTYNDIVTPTQRSILTTVKDPNIVDDPQYATFIDARKRTYAYYFERNTLSTHDRENLVVPEDVMEFTQKILKFQRQKGGLMSQSKYIQEIWEKPTDPDFDKRAMKAITGLVQGDYVLQQATEMIFFTTRYNAYHTLPPDFFTYPDFSKQVHLFQKTVAERVLLPALDPVNYPPDAEFDADLEKMFKMIDAKFARAFAHNVFFNALSADLTVEQVTGERSAGKQLAQCPIQKIALERSNSYQYKQHLVHDLLRNNIEEIKKNLHARFGNRKAVNIIADFLEAQVKIDVRTEDAKVVASIIQDGGGEEFMQHIANNEAHEKEANDANWEQDKEFVVNYWKKHSHEENLWRLEFGEDNKQRKHGMDNIEFAILPDDPEGINFSIEMVPLERYFVRGRLQADGTLTDLSIDGNVVPGLEEYIRTVVMGSCKQFIQIKLEQEREQAEASKPQEINVDYLLSRSSDFLKAYTSLEGNNREDLDKKFHLARTLIDDGRWFALPNIDHLSILSNFIPDYFESPDFGLNSEEVEYAKDLRDQLRLLCIEKGFIQLDSEEGEAAQETVARIIENDAQLQGLIGELPIEIMGALLMPRLFKNIREDEKKEQLRAWTTRSLLRPYLGDLAIRRRRGEVSFKELLELVPEEVFNDSDKIVNNLLRHYFVNQSMRLFNNGEAEGFSQLAELIEREDQPIKKAFLESIFTQFQEISTVAQRLQIHNRFNTDISAVFADQVPFPHFRQKSFVYEFLRPDRNPPQRILLNGGTGSTKTACGYLAMEAAGAKKVTIFGPANARNTWLREAKKLFRPDQNPEEMVFTVESLTDLDTAEFAQADYVYISGNLLARAKSNPDIYIKVQHALLNVRDTDGIIIDESHNFRNPDAKSTQILVDISQQVQKNRPVVPMIALTATPIESTLKDLDVTMAVLYPQKFAVPKSQQQGKLTFSEQCLKNPQIAYSYMFGEELMLQWNVKDIFGEKVPKLEYRRENISMQPYNRMFYEWVAKLPLEPLQKIYLLQGALLNPEIVKQGCRDNGFDKEFIENDEEILQIQLMDLHTSWENWIQTKHKDIPDEPFSADWIAQRGHDTFLLSCFFNDALEGGVDGLVKKYEEQLPVDLVNAWTAQEFPSAKFETAIKIAKEAAQNDEQVIFIASHHQRGISRRISDRRTSEEDLADNFWSFAELLEIALAESGITEEQFESVHGRIEFEERDAIAQRWRGTGDSANFMVVTLKSMMESVDLAVRELPDNANVKGIKVVFLDWPWGWSSFEQMCGRFLRPGIDTGKSVDIMILEAENSIDHGFHDLVRHKQLFIQMALAGVELSEEERAFFEDAQNARRILFSDEQATQRYLDKTMMGLKTQGEYYCQERLGRPFAEAYYNHGKDEQRVVGHNAEVVRRILTAHNAERILSLGAGSCLLARKIDKADGNKPHIINLDLNQQQMIMMHTTYEGRLGEMLVGRASDLRAAKIQDEEVDAVDCSFMLDWTKINLKNVQTVDDIADVERVKVLSEMNRVLKPGGTAVITLPNSAFDEETFATFVSAMQTSFGFSVVEDLTGSSHAFDEKKKKDLGWIITLKKEGNVNIANLDPRNLLFLTDNDFFISRVRKNKPKKSKKEKKLEELIFDAQSFMVRSTKGTTKVIEESLQLQSDATAQAQVSTTTVIQKPYKLSEDKWWEQNHSKDKLQTIKQVISQDVSRSALWDKAIGFIQTRTDIDRETCEQIFAIFAWDDGLDQHNNWNEDLLLGFAESITATIFIPYASVQEFKNSLATEHKSDLFTFEQVSKALAQRLFTNLARRAELNEDAARRAAEKMVYDFLLNNPEIYGMVPWPYDRIWRSLQPIVRNCISYEQTFNKSFLK